MYATKQTKVWILGLALLAGCGRDDDKKTEEAAEPAASGTVSGMVSQAPAPVVSDERKTVDVLDKIAASVASIPSEGTAASLQDGPQCSVSALPIHPDASRNTARDPKDPTVAVLPESDAGFSTRRFECLLTVNTGDADSVQGAIGEARMTACIMQEIEKYDGVERTIIVEIATNECMPQRIKDDTPASITHVEVKAIGQRPAAFGGAGWTKSLTAVLKPVGAPADQAMTMRFLGVDDPSLYAVAMLGGGTPNDAFAVYVDPAAKRLTYEARFQRLEYQGWATHIRVGVNGEMDLDAKFTSMTSIEGLYSRIDGPAQGSNEVSNGRILTVLGDFPGQVYSHNYACTSNCSANDVRDWPEQHGLAGDGIEILQDADLDFVMNARAGGTIPVSQWILTVPLTF